MTRGRVTGPPKPKEIEPYELAKLRGRADTLSKTLRVRTLEELHELGSVMCALFEHIAYLEQKLLEEKGND